MSRSADPIGTEDASPQRLPGEMTLVEHLAELRTRLSRAALALAVGTVVGYAVFPTLIDGLMAPYCTVVADLRPGESCSLVALRPLEPFSVRIRTSLLVGLFVGGPVIFYQLWRFITPGLTKRERRYALPFVIASQVMFGAGLAFAYLVIPQGLRVLLTIGGPSIEALLAASEYLTFFLAMSLAFGLVFELPLVMIFLSLAGVVRASSLSTARPYAVVGIFTLAAIITPTVDPVTLVLVAGPMWLFYELSILVARLIERRRRRREAA